MPYKSKLTIKFDSEWSYPSSSIYGDQEVPEQHLTLEFPVEDCNTSQIFHAFANFMLSMGHNEIGIMKGACSVAFNEMRREDDMKKVANEYDLIMAEELPEIIEERLKFEKELSDEESILKAEIRDLKAKISRLENPDNPNYTDEEMDAMCEQAEETNKKKLLNKLQNAGTVCHDCGKKYGNYSVSCSSTWQGTCGVCGQEKPVTETRDYGYMRKGILELLKDE